MKFLVVSAILLAHTFLTSAQVFSYCDLSPPQTQEDLEVILETQLDTGRYPYPRDKVQAALARDDGARAFIQAQSLARQQNQAQNPQRNPSKAVDSPSAKKYSVPQMYEGLCQEEQVQIVGKFRAKPEGGVEFCHVVEEQVMTATSCGNDLCDVHNDMPLYQQYYCIPDSFVYESAMVLCTDTEELTFESFKIPIQCVCKKINCNLDGMNF